MASMRNVEHSDGKEGNAERERRRKVLEELASLVQHFVRVIIKGLRVMILQTLINGLQSIETRALKRRQSKMLKAKL